LGVFIKPHLILHIFSRLLSKRIDRNHVVSKLKCPVLLASEMSGFWFSVFI